MEKVLRMEMEMDCGVCGGMRRVDIVMVVVCLATLS